MAHMLDFTAGRAAMAYVGETPWHGFGAQLERGASVETWQEAAALNWTVERASVAYRTPAHGVKTVDDRKVLYRSDTGGALGIMSESRYNVVQPKDVLEFYRDLIDATDGAFDLETAGALSDGKRIWALARRRESARVMGQDEIRPYILLATSYDGSMSTVGKFTTVRVVCNNTLTMANAKTATDVRVPHSRNFDPKAVKKELAKVDTAFAEFMDRATRLAAVNVTERDAFDFFARLYGPQKIETLDVELPPEADFSSRQKNTINALMSSFYRGPGAELLSAKGTAWGLVNAVTRYQDFDASTRGDASNRFASGQFGQGARAKDAAVALASQIADRVLLAA